MEGRGNYRARKLALISRYIIGLEFTYENSYFIVKDCNDEYHSELYVFIYNIKSCSIIPVELESFCNDILSGEFKIIRNEKFKT